VVTGRLGPDRGDWVTLFPGLRMSRGWMERHTPQLLTDWCDATSEERRRAIAGLIVRVAATRDRDGDASSVFDDPSWLHLLMRIDPRLPDDPDWMALAMTMTRAAATGYDVGLQLPELARHPPLPGRHPARELHWRLLVDCPAAVHTSDGLPPDR
jgi:hypothetical protein